MKVILLLGLCVAFSLAQKLPYIRYEDVLEVYEDSKFSQTTATHHGISSKSLCTLMCLKDEDCIWVAHDAEDATCTFVEEDTTATRQWAYLEYQPGSRLSFLHERFTGQFEAGLMDIKGGIVLHTKKRGTQEDCFKMCYEESQCFAALTDYHEKSCSVRHGGCVGDDYGCKTYSKYRKLMHTGEKASLFIPSIRPIDSCILVGIKADMDLCDFLYTFKDMTSRRCELKCKYDTRNRCKIWQSDANVGTCTICFWSAETFDRIVVTDSPTNILGIIQHGLACPMLTSVRIDMPGEPYSNLNTAEKCAHRCRTNPLFPCSQWSHYDNTCVLSGAPHVKAKQDTRAITGFIHRDSKIYEPCVFKGVQYKGGARLKSATDRQNFAGCWQWCFNTRRCTKVTYLFADDMCTLFNYYGSLTFYLEDDYLSATRRGNDGSCKLRTADFTGKIIVPPLICYSPDECKEQCIERSNEHGDCYGYTYRNYNLKCELYGQGDNRVYIGGLGITSGQIQF